MTIIGVVAALTVPTLMQKYTYHTYVTGVKKAYSILQTAVNMIPITEGCPAGDFDCAGAFDGKDVDGQSFGGNSNAKFLYLLSKNMKIAQLCLEYSSKECRWVYTYNPTTDFGLKTLDGTTYKSVAINGYQTIIVDVNGVKKPDLFGRDKYMFHIASEARKNIPQGTVLPWGSKIRSIYTYTGHEPGYHIWDYWRTSPTSNCTTNDVKAWSNGIFCTGRVLEENAMNY